MEDESPYEIAVARFCGRTSEADARLREAIAATLLRHRVQAARVSVALVDDARMAEINEKHLAHKGPTDVITFDLRDDRDTQVGAQVDGELVLSVETATREAERRGHGVDAELALYAVHGILHLLGYDDSSKDDSDRMHETEDEILTEIGVGPVYKADMR